MKLKQTTIRLPYELMEQLRRAADEGGFSVKDLVLFILRSWLKENASVV